MAERRAVLNVRRGKTETTTEWTLAEAIGEVAEIPALKDCIASAKTDGKATIEGLWLGAIAPVIAAWRQHEERPILVITPQVAEAESVGAEIDEYLSAIHKDKSEERWVDAFPPGSEETELESLAHQETAQRLHVLSRLYKFAEDRDSGNESNPPVVTTTLPALLQSVPSPNSLEGDKQVLVAGKQIDLDKLKSWLTEAGYHSTTSVQLPGEFALRGGILDIYPPDESLPVRVELFDDEIESLRTFDVVSQRSIEKRESLQLLAVQGSVAQDGSILDYLPSDTLVVVHEQRAVAAAGEAFLQRVPFPDRFASPQTVWGQLASYSSAYTTQLADEGYLGQLYKLPIGNVERIGGDLERLGQDIDAQCVAKPDRRVVVVAMNDGERERLQELLASSDVVKSERLDIVSCQLQNGFELLPDRVLVLTAGQLLRRTHVRRVTKRTKSKPIDSFLDLRQGDLVVHLSHGIGVYRGTELLEKHGQKFEHLVLEFDGGTKIFVPSSKIELVQRYVGGTKSRPRLAKIGGQSWARQKKAAERAVQDMAVELLELQARRNSQPGVTFAVDSIWQNQFDALLFLCRNSGSVDGDRSCKRRYDSLAPDGSPYLW